MRLSELFEDVWHGTPHRFDRFDSQHFGSGEGVAAYGHGMYFAGDPEIARYYRDAISYTTTVTGKRWIIPDDVSPEVGEIIVRLLSRFRGMAEPDFILRHVTEMAGSVRDTKAHLDHLEQRISDFPESFWQDHPALLRTKQEEIETYRKELATQQDAVTALPWLRRLGVEAFVAPGHLYHVEIPEGPYLDWDANLDEQPPAVQAALERSGLLQRFLDDPDARPGFHTRSFPAQGFYRTLAKDPMGGYRHGRAASELLKQAGIIGIKYLDSNSRTGGDSYNYVVFDDQHTKIKHVE